MSHILTVGIATLDIINKVAHYPAEDEEMRALSQRVECGGNAANTASVLAQYNHTVEFAGVLANEPDGHRIEQQLKARHVGTQYCQHLKKSKAPTSYITLNQQNGSRTIVHCRDLPEFSFHDFLRIPLQHFDWFHFEGRNVADLQKMLVQTKQQCSEQTISLEIEKEREDVDSLLPLADILIFSRVFVMTRGFDAATTFFDSIQQHSPNTILVCSWGEEGAWARDYNGQDYHVPAYPPLEIIDTIGAGDTFNAGLIHAMASGQPLADALDHACQLAGKKVGQNGIADLVD